MYSFIGLNFVEKRTGENNQLATQNLDQFLFSSNNQKEYIVNLKTELKIQKNSQKKRLISIQETKKSQQRQISCLRNQQQKG